MEICNQVWITWLFSICLFKHFLNICFLHLCQCFCFKNSIMWLLSIVSSFHMPIYFNFFVSFTPFWEIILKDSPLLFPLIQQSVAWKGFFPDIGNSGSLFFILLPVRQIFSTFFSCVNKNNFLHTGNLSPPECGFLESPFFSNQRLWVSLYLLVLTGQHPLHPISFGKLSSDREVASSVFLPWSDRSNPSSSAF